MDNKPVAAAYVTLIHHKLISCSAETLLKQTESKGGTLEFVTTMEFPDEDIIIKPGENYSIKVRLDCSGKETPTGNFAFKASCEMEGLCAVINVPDEGIASKPIYWLMPANQLYPLLSQFTSGLIYRMGYKDVEIPLTIHNGPTDKANVSAMTSRKRTKKSS